VKALEKELKDSKQQLKEIQSGGGGIAGGDGATPSEPELEFGMSEKDLANQQGDLTQAMKQNLDYGQNDINSSGGNIFEVLSNRYQRSGMRRLFDDEGKTQADKASDTDINK
jgi:hypothetical protein